MKDLTKFIKSELEAGSSREEIKRSLLEVGWGEEQIEKAFPEEGSPGVLSLLKKVARRYKERFLVLVGISILPTLFVMALLWGIEHLSSNSVVVVVISLIGSILSLVISLWGTTALTYAVVNSGSGILDSYRSSWKKIASYWYVSFLISFIVVGGSLFLIIPGIIFSVWFMFSMFILFKEDLKGMEALQKSRWYVSGNWWDIVWKQFAGNLIMVLAFALVASIPAIPAYLIGGRAAFDVVIRILGVFFAPLTLLYSYTIYEALQKAKSGLEFEKKGKGPLVIGILGTVLGLVGAIILAVFLSGVVGKSMGDAKSKAKDARIMADMSQLRAVAERGYDGDYDGLRGGSDELRADIEEQGGDLTIHIDGDRYCAYSSLSSGGYYCVDSEGGVLETSDPSSCDISFECIGGR